MLFWLDFIRIFLFVFNPNFPGILNYVKETDSEMVPKPTLSKYGVYNGESTKVSTHSEPWIRCVHMKNVALY